MGNKRTRRYQKEICPACLACENPHGDTTMQCSCYATCERFRSWFAKEFQSCKDELRPSEKALGHIHISTFEEGKV